MGIFQRCPNCGNNESWTHIRRCINYHIFCETCATFVSGCPACGSNDSVEIGNIAVNTISDFSDANVYETIPTFVNREHWFDFPTDLISELSRLGYKIHKKYENEISYWVKYDNEEKKIIVYNKENYIYFKLQTKFAFDFEKDFGQNLLYKTLSYCGDSLEYYFGIQKTQHWGHDDLKEKYVLTTYFDQWKGSLKKDWIQYISETLIKLCLKLEREF